MLRYSNLFSGGIEVVELNNPPKARNWPSMVVYAQSYIFVSGGANATKYQSYYNIVKVYSLAEDAWWEAPPLNVPRYGHTSCAL